MSIYPVRRRGSPFLFPANYTVVSAAWFASLVPAVSVCDSLYKLITMKKSKAGQFQIKLLQPFPVKQPRTSQNSRRRMNDRACTNREWRIVFCRSLQPNPGEPEVGILKRGCCFFLGIFLKRYRCLLTLKFVKDCKIVSLKNFEWVFWLTQDVKIDTHQMAILTQRITWLFLCQFQGRRS